MGGRRGESTGGVFPSGEEMSKFSADGGYSPHPPLRENAELYSHLLGDIEHVMHVLGKILPKYS